MLCKVCISLDHRCPTFFQLVILQWLHKNCSIDYFLCIGFYNINGAPRIAWTHVVQFHSFVVECYLDLIFIVMNWWHIFLSNLRWHLVKLSFRWRSIQAFSVDMHHFVWVILKVAHKPKNCRFLRFRRTCDMVFLRKDGILFGMWCVLLWVVLKRTCSEF